MTRIRFAGFFSLLTLLLAACAPHGHLASASGAPREKPVWAFEQSDVALDPAFRFGRLPNGMRFAIRQNATPKGTALVRMDVAAGSLDEHEDERGLAHFIEHMAFEGSSHVPEGEMIRLLERKGLAFGADTNAQTGFEQTIYKLDLPRADPELLDTALMLMRETAGELQFDPAAVERERGVILAEKRERNTWQYRNAEDQAKFLNPEARYPRRFPIGTSAVIAAATADQLKALWRRLYVPSRTTVIVVGDFPPDAVEAAIRAHFADWQPAIAPPQPGAGPVLPGDKGRTEIYIDPALSERVTASRHGRWLGEPDTIAQRQENVLRQIGYGIVNRRLQHVARRPDPPFRGAGFGTSEVFKAGRTTNLVVDTVDRRWRHGLVAAAGEYRRALAEGFTAGEVAEQVANIRAATENAAASAATRSNGALVEAVFALIHDDKVPSTPQSALERLTALLPRITPEAVLAALKREALPLRDPLLRFQGRNDPVGGAPALRAAWNDAMGTHLTQASAAAAAAAGFAYSDFGPLGQVVSDTREPLLGIRELRFANGVRLNLKQTDLEQGRVMIQLSVDGGDMLDTRSNPLATEMVSALAAGGLGKHSQDELQSLLAGHSIGVGLASTPLTFVSVAQTTPRDLELQLDVLAATITDPGYRPEGEAEYRLGINNFFDQIRATPGSTLRTAIGGILSDNDPRFTLQKPQDYRALTYARLKRDIGDRLARGAIEIGIVGDIPEDQAIGLVAKTFGALPPREPEFRPYTEQRANRPFTEDHSRRVLLHTGPADQALVRFTWRTRDDSDPQARQVFNMLDRVVQIALTEGLREKLGKAYSPSASSDLSRFWHGYGTFAITASVESHDVAATRAAILETVRALRETPPSPDVFLRARAPLLESFANALKSNRGWLGLVDRAQTEPEKIERQVHAADRLLTVTPADVQAAARRYLTDAAAVEVDVLPEGMDAPP